ncbi:MAG: hypothetical protein A2X94_08565 [Bdellovibrionales bacterium GWB1_55_8]|nr:MAG: hypothetical protein A2X94_08565 [Bdellovibrionales bacterium GWB1_55_8]
MAAILVLASSLLLGACSDGQQDPADYGIEKIEVTLSTENQPQLLHGGIGKLKVPARLKAADQWFSGHLSLSGNFTIDAWKSSFRFDATEMIPGFEFRSMKLSAQTQDPTFLRTTLAAHVFSALSVPIPATRPVALHINGVYAGLYLAIERINVDFYRKRGFDPDRIFQAKTNAADFGEEMVVDPEHGFEPKGGAFYPQELKRLAAETARPADAEQLTRIGAVLELDNAISHLAVRLFIRDCDGFANNMYLHRDRSDGKIRFSGWDWERAWGSQCDLASLFRQNLLFAKLIEHPSLRAALTLKLKLLQGMFPPSRLKELGSAESARLRTSTLSDPYFITFGIDSGADSEALFASVELWSQQIDEFVRGTPIAPSL